MNSHPLDPIALIAGLVTLVGGIVALLHQGGAMHLGPAALATIACVTLGLAGAGGVFLANRKPNRSPGDTPN